MRVQVVPLKEAMSINGLRAVFGEQYPDPVRVVAVGNKVSDMVAAPDKDDWLTGSVELCGGTHIKNTKEAHGFALVNEEASARPQTSSACVCLLLAAAVSWRLLLCVGAPAPAPRPARAGRVLVRRGRWLPRGCVQGSCGEGAMGGHQGACREPPCLTASGACAAACWRALCPRRLAGLQACGQERLAQVVCLQASAPARLDAQAPGLQASRPRTCAALSCVSTRRVARAVRRASRHDMRARAWATGDVTGASGGMAGGGQGHPTRDGRDVAARRAGACDGRCAVGAA